MSSFSEPPAKFSGSQFVDHDGTTPVPTDADIFVLPPPEIGELISVHTSLKVSQQPRSTLSRVGLCLVIAAVISLIDVLVGHFVPLKRNQLATIEIFLVLVAICSMGLAWYATRFNHHVSFVGKLGLARCRLKGSRENPPTAELFLFPTATDLRTSETRMYHNGIYSGTTYNYSWSTPGGANVFTLKGQYRSQEGTPPTTNEYWLAKAGEIAWCEYLFDKTAEELEAKGFIQFPLTKQDFVRVGPGFLEFGMKGEVARVTPDQIASLNLSNGQFSIKTHDAGWFGSKGKFSFSYGSMANARLFLFALDRLFGYQV